MGLNNLAGGEGNTQFLPVEEIFINPNYYWSENDYNIALLKMAEPFTISDYVGTACLPEMGQEFDQGTMGTVTGWGSAETGGECKSAAPCKNAVSAKTQYLHW